jgi:hypothetical protein
MEKIIETFENLNQKAKIVDDAMKVLPHKLEIRNKLVELSAKDKEIEDLKKMVDKSIKEHNSVIKSQYKETTATINRVNMKMMLLMEYMDTTQKLPAPAIEQENSPKKVLSELSLNNQENFSSRMTLATYSKSPMVKQRLKIQLQFTDFEAEITEEAFSNIPSYMKLRASMSDLQHFLDNVITKTFNEKYQILLKKTSVLKKGELDLQIMFKDQANLFEGEKFITDGDLARTLEKNIDKKDNRFLQMLRHLHIIREARKSSVVAYIWLKKF